MMFGPLLVPHAGLCQVAAPPSQEVTGLDDIVVTAQRRSENLQTVPIAITAASAETLAANGVTSAQQLNTVAPGLNIRNNSGAFQPSLRGIGTSSTVVENPVALYVDGVYLSNQREGVREFNDVEQVAVLKGPQGTLFGRNATGGVIQITTRRPSHEVQGSAAVSVDNYATLKSDLYLTGGLSEAIAGSLSLQYGTQGEGWGDNLTTGSDTFRLRHQFSGRGKILIEPDVDTSILVAADYSDWNQLSNSYQPYPGTTYSYPGVGPLASVYDTYAGVDSFNAFKGGGASVTVDRDLAFAKLVSISAWRRGDTAFAFDNTNVAQPYFIVSSDSTLSESYSQEFQLVSPKSDFSWMVGAFYFHNRFVVDPQTRSFSGPLAPAATSNAFTTTVGEEITESVAPFGQIDWRLLPATTLTLGARYTYEKRDVVARTDVLRVNGTTASVSRAESITIRKPTFRAVLSHDFDRDILGYVSFNTGIKSGGFNVINPANAGYLPEELNAFEMGLKSQLLDHRLRLNAAAFYYDYTNLQVIQFLGGVQTIVNGAAAELYGLDLDFEAQLTTHWRASGGLELLHAEFSSFPNAAVGTPRAGGGATLVTGDVSGNRLPLAQDVTATTALDYETRTDHGLFNANLTVNYNGSYFFEPDNFLRQPAYVLVNASLKWTLPDDRVSFSLWGRNLLDEHVIAQVPTQSFGYAASYGNAPRTYGVSVRAAF